jgi:hypothetical protein
MELRLRIVVAGAFFFVFFIVVPVGETVAQRYVQLQTFALPVLNR